MLVFAQNTLKPLLKKKSLRGIIVAYLSAPEQICECNRLGGVVHLALDLRWPRRDVMHCFLGACSWGNFGMVKQLSRAFAVRDFVGKALQKASSNGHLQIVQWLVSQFELLSEDVWADCRTLRYMCVNGHLATAQWLVSMYGTPADTHDTKTTLLEVCCCGHLAVAQWLAEEIKLNAEDVRDDNCSVLRDVCSSGHLKVAQWLVWKFKLTIGDVRACRALQAACSFGHLVVAWWLVAEFTILTLKDAKMTVTRPFKMRAQMGT